MLNMSLKKGDTNKPSMRVLEFDVIIGKNSTFDGTLRSGGSIRIDGRTTGDIHADGEVIIGQDAVCIGNITSSNIEISGNVTGNITSGGCMKIYDSGLLKGDIEVTSFVIDEGGVFEGLCHINTHKALAGTHSEQDAPAVKSEDKKTDIKMVK